ncbi:hypothetical protein AYO44_16055 [Planctomycetaceae bacterium SCGC AG-212-F19]|nr:hypothetical protein AYO44_16055 [Planctomycetaceae bacterium SCGC AG-212-F19]
MPTVIDCPHCSRNLSLPEEALSREVQCPGCGGKFHAARSGAEAAANEVPRVILEVDEIVALPIPGVPPPPRGLVPVLLSSSQEAGSGESEMLMERCGRCGARISRALDHCISCGAHLRRPEEKPWEREGAPPRRDCEAHRGSLILALGRVSLCFAVPGLLGVAFLPFALASLVGSGLGLTVSLMARDDLEQMRRKVMDPDGEQSTLTGQTCSSIGLVIGIVGLLLAGLLRLPQLFAGF